MTGKISRPIAECLALVVGAPRSGTTWLQLMLFNTGRVASSVETHLFTSYLGQMDRTWQRHATTHRDQHRAIGLPQLIERKEFLAMCRYASNRVLRRIRAMGPEDGLIVEKTPGNIVHSDLILGLYPRARFVHIVRDPRAVVASTVAARQWATEWASAEPAELVRRWKATIAAGRSLAVEHPESYFELRYEDLHQDTPGRLLELCAWLDIGIEREDAERIAAECAIPNLRSGRAKAPWDLSREPADFFRSGSTDGWKTELDPATIRQIEDLAGDEMTLLGYAPTQDADREPKPESAGAARPPKADRRKPNGRHRRV